MSLYNRIIDLQKLQSSWRQVYKNKPGEGIDGVTCEEFEADKDSLIKELWKELKDNTYKCQPVKLVPLYKGEKVRYISMYTMRDKIVQHSVAKELTNLFDYELQKSAYAYRTGKSAMHAAQDIEKCMIEMKQGFALKTDIHSFFDCILHERLRKILRTKIREEDVIKLLFQFIKVPSIDKNGELTEKRTGIYQGATIAPILSNIYMIETDKLIEQETDFYVRYSDDILILFSDLKQAEEYCKKLELYISEIGLTLNEKKTQIVSFEQGFEFLGYAFNTEGISIPEKAEMQLNERLETIWLDKSYVTLEERVKKGAEIVGGWEQYFRSDRKMKSILEYVIWVYQLEKKGIEKPELLKKNREDFVNCYKDITLFLASVWKKYGMLQEMLMEYEQYYNIDQLDRKKEIADTAELQKLILMYERYMVDESEEIRTELVQFYTDKKMYQKAESLFKSKENSSRWKYREKFYKADQQNWKMALNDAEIAKYMDLFVGREDVYAVDSVINYKRNIEDVLQPLLADKIIQHLEGKETLGTYIQRSNGTVKYMVLDLDISKGILLQNPDELLMKEYMEKCLRIAVEILKELAHMGLRGYLEKSGCRGYHIWIFFEEWIPVRYANFLSDIIEEKKGKLWREGEIQIEYFPNKTKLRNGKKGQVIKLPWGIHPKTGRRSYFLRETLDEYIPQTELFDDVVKYSVNIIKKIISANHTAESIDVKKKYTEVDKNLDDFQITSEAVRTVMLSCNLIRFLCQKAKTVHYLNHCERLSILYVFGHLGEEGKEFIHKIMSFTLNYSYQVTQKFILKCPEKPVSCLKLREQYKQISAEIGCSCGFKRTKNCYPSPVLHALKNAEENEQITMPVSRVISTDKQKIMKTEINAVSRAQEIAEKMMELRKQKRSLDRSLVKCEQELAEIFNDSNTDSMEIKMGLLTRRKAGTKTEWIIEL